MVAYLWKSGDSLEEMCWLIGVDVLAHWRRNMVSN